MEENKEEKKNRKIDNFAKYLEHKGITDNRATRECKLAQGLIGNTRKNGNYDLGYVSVRRILERYTDLSEKFLLTGEGPMLNTDRSLFPKTESAPVNNLCVHTNEEFDRMTKTIEDLTSKLDLCHKEISLLKDTIDFMKSLVKKND